MRRDDVNLGLAVDVEKTDGSRTLLVPNVKGADAMTFAEFVAAADDVVTRARDGQDPVSRLRGHDDLADQPGHARNDGVGASADAGPGRDRRDRRDGLPGASSARWRRRRSSSLGDQQGRHVHVDLRPPDHPGRGVRRLPRRASRSCSSAARLLRRHLRRPRDPYRPLRWAADKNPPSRRDGAPRTRSRSRRASSSSSTRTASAATSSPTSTRCGTRECAPPGARPRDATV